MTTKEEAYDKLFHGKSNILQGEVGSARADGSEDEKKFTEYVKARPINDWELDISMSWPYN